METAEEHEPVSLWSAVAFCSFLATLLAALSMAPMADAHIPPDVPHAPSWWTETIDGPGSSNKTCQETTNQTSYGAYSRHYECKATFPRGTVTCSLHRTHWHYDENDGFGGKPRETADTTQCAPNLFSDPQGADHWTCVRFYWLTIVDDTQQVTENFDTGWSDYDKNEPYDCRPELTEAPPEGPPDCVGKCEPDAAKKLRCEVQGDLPICKILVTCPIGYGPDGFCKERPVVQVADEIAGLVKGRAGQTRHARKAVVFAKGVSLGIPAGESETVKLKISRAGRALVKAATTGKKRKSKLRAEIRFASTRGQKVTIA